MHWIQVVSHEEQERVLILHLGRPGGDIQTGTILVLGSRVRWFGAHLPKQSFDKVNEATGQVLRFSLENAESLSGKVKHVEILSFDHPLCGIFFIHGSHGSLPC